MIDRQHEYQKLIKGFRLIDDDFFSVCLDGNLECVEYILHIILNRTDLKVTKAETQYSIQNLLRRSVRLDVHALDENGNQYDIEIQRRSEGADPKRARFNSSMMDADMARSGSDYTKLAENYVIFITEKDYWGKAKPVYHFQRVCVDFDLTLSDGSHIIYVNGSCRDDSPIGQLMFDFNCNDPEQMKHPVLAKHTRYFKEDAEGVTKMCKAMEDFTTKIMREENIQMAYDAYVNRESSLESLIRIFKFSAAEAEELKHRIDSAMDISE